MQSQFAPSELQLLGKGAANAFGGGAFLGYNTQWQDLVLGVEANYTHTSLNLTPPSTSVARSIPINTSLPLSIPAGTVTSVSLGKASGHLNLTDYAEGRGRAGYVVGNLLPYGFVGVVVGRADYSVTATTDVQCILFANALIQGECGGFPLTVGAGQNNALLWGYSVGAGLDWALTRNFFLRGEFQFVQFAPISNISVENVSGRIGAGYKF